MLNLYRKELVSFFSSWTAYLAMGIFLLLAGLIFWVFPDTAIPDQGYASMDGFFYLIPYLLLFLIPAICMRMLAGERQEGTLEWLYTQPLSDVSIVFAKFLAGITVLVITLIPTFIYVYALAALAMPTGQLDYGSIWGSYAGLGLLSATFVGISLAASAMTRQVMAAFLLAVVGCFLLYSGPAALSGLLGEGRAAESLSMWGMQAHFESLGRGVIDSRDLLYFIGFTLFFLLLTERLLQGQRMGGGRVSMSFFVRTCFLPIMSIMAVFLAVLFISQDRYFRVDLTEDRRFSLSAITKETLDYHREQVTATLLLGGDLPPTFQRLKKESEDLLKELKSHAGDRFSYHQIHLPELPEAAQQAWSHALSDRGLSPVHLSVNQPDGSLTQRLVYPFIWLSQGENHQVVSLLQGQATGGSSEQAVHQAINQLEYGLVSAMRKLGQTRKPLIGITEGHGEADELELRDALHALSVNHQVGLVDLEAIDQATLDQLDVLAIIRPRTAFSEAEKYKIDYYLTRGGKLLLAWDQLDGSLDSLRQSPEGAQMLWKRELNLDDLLFNYGLRFNADVLLDLNSLAVPMDVGGGKIELVSWPLHPLIVPDSPHPLVKNLSGIRTEFLGSLDTMVVEGIRKEFLLYSSPYVRSLVPGTVLSLDLVQQLPSAEALLAERLPVAVLLEGQFPSAYQHRMRPEGIGPDFQVSGVSREGRIFAVADGEVFINQVHPEDLSAYPLGWDRYTEQQYGNKALLLNLMDYFLDSPELMQLRQKEIHLRPVNTLLWHQEKTKWRLITIVLPLLLTILAGGTYLRMRYRRYRRR